MFSSESPSVVVITLFCLGIWLFLWRTFVPPPELRNLPRAPILPLIYSYVTAETEERRTIRLLLPCAQRHQSGVVLVWAFGLWIVHCVDPKVCMDISYPYTSTNIPIL